MASNFDWKNVNSQGNTADSPLKTAGLDSKDRKY